MQFTSTSANTNIQDLSKHNFESIISIDQRIYWIIIEKQSTNKLTFLILMKIFNKKSIFDWFFHSKINSIDFQLKSWPSNEQFHNFNRFSIELRPIQSIGGAPPLDWLKMASDWNWPMSKSPKNKVVFIWFFDKKSLFPLKWSVLTTFDWNRPDFQLAITTRAYRIGLFGSELSKNCQFDWKIAIFQSFLVTFSINWRGSLNQSIGASDWLKIDQFQLKFGQFCQFFNRLIELTIFRYIEEWVFAELAIL